jgi:hypothetical protein
MKEKNKVRQQTTLKCMKQIISIEVWRFTSTPIEPIDLARKLVIGAGPFT